MTEQELYHKLSEHLQSVIHEYKLAAEYIHLATKGLTPQEAIGTPQRTDYPILNGKEVLVQAEVCGSIGQGFSDAPIDFDGTLADVLLQDMSMPHNRTLLVASLNAVLRHVGAIDHTIHCRNHEPELCAEHYAHFLLEEYGEKTRIALIGYQPALTARLAQSFSLRVLDLNPDIVGTNRSGICIEHGTHDFHAVVAEWADLILCTGSTLCNGSFVTFLNLKKEVIFFGTTGAAITHIFGLKRLCPLSA